MVKLSKKTDEEILNELKRAKLQELDRIFASQIAPTDYVITKIQEAQITGQDLSSLLQKYQTKLQWRQTLRKWKDAKEQAIMNAQNKEELANIDLEDFPRLEE